MEDELDLRPMAYIIIVLGCGLAFATAVVPHYTAGHKLLVDILLIGLVPYLVYGALTEMLSSWSLVTPGALILAVDAATKIPERWLSTGDFPSLAVYLSPLWLVLIVLPLGIFLGRRMGKSASR